MKALVLSDYKQLDLKDIDEPKPTDNEVLIRTKACGICGSDVHGYDGSTGRRRPPIVMDMKGLALWKRLEPLLSVVAPLEDGAEWFRRLYKHESGLLKVVLQP